MSKKIKPNDSVEHYLSMFYQDYRQWLVDGAIESKTFTRDVGLCSAIRNWDHDKQLGMLSQLQTEFSRQLREAGYSTAYPFNSDVIQYHNISFRAKHHLNRARTQWVKAHSKPIPNEVFPCDGWIRRLWVKYKAGRK